MRAKTRLTVPLVRDGGGELRETTWDDALARAATGLDQARAAGAQSSFGMFSCSKARATHPIFFHHLLKGVHNGARLIGVDPRRTSSAQWADLWLGLDVGSDIALANAM